MNEARFGRSPSPDNGEGAGESREAIMGAAEVGDGARRGRSGAPLGSTSTAGAAAKQAHADMFALSDLQDDRPEPPKMSPGSIVTPQPSNLGSEVSEVKATGSAKNVVCLGDEVELTSSAKSIVALGDEAANSALRGAAEEVPAKLANELEPALKESL